MSNSDITSRYPKSVSLPGGGKVELRLMAASDKKAILAFSKALPEEDLLFLSVDLTEPDVVDDWIANVKSGDSVSLLAFDDKGIVGYATVHRSRARWTRRVGELRVNVGAAYRSKGLGRHLTGEIFDVARDIGLNKLVANMTTDQKGAQAAFRRLGFIAEALFSDHVEDRKGGLRDMVVMSYDIAGHTEQVDDRVRI